MKNRLEELLEQKRLLESHLQWLEKEISAERSSSDRTPAPGASPDNKPGEAPAEAAPAAGDTVASSDSPPEQRQPSESKPGTEAATAPTALPIDPDQLEVDHGALKSEVRRGCLIYLAIFGTLTLIVALVAYFMYR